MNFEELKKKLLKHAKLKGFKLNSNNKLVKIIINKLISNKEIKGNYYCPCRLEFSEQTICPCVDHEEQVKKKGRCNCSLFVK